MPQDSMPRKDGQKKAFRNPNFSLPVVISWLSQRLADSLMKTLSVRDSGFVTTAERNTVHNLKKHLRCGVRYGESGHIQENYECEGQSHDICCVRRFSSLICLRWLLHWLRRTWAEGMWERENLRFNVDHCNWYISAKFGLLHWKILLLEIIVSHTLGLTNLCVFIMSFPSYTVSDTWQMLKTCLIY